MIMKAINLMKSARAAVFSSDLTEYEMQHEDGSYLEPAESIIAYRKQWLADGAVMFSPDCCPAQQKKVKSMF